MAIQRTVWSPDTCGCVITYEWDDSMSQEDRVHTPVKTNMTRVCPKHAAHAHDHVAHHAVVLAENQKKNGKQ